ncbi:MAG: hypothetical protein QOH58_663 [Thermoleophilaceae bacterium]|jgi:hypothetical protein|nr:hypothetical protein [Thermoleophilaceae bacterium]
MTVDYTDETAIDAFAAEVERELDAAGSSEMWPLLATWALAGVLFTLGAALDVGLLYVAGLLVVAFWVAGVLLARGPSGWWGL